MASISSSKSDHDLPRWGPNICLNSSCVSFQGFKLNLPQHLLKVNPEFINPGWFIGMCLNQWHDVQVPFWKHLENILKQRSVQQKKSCPSLERWNSQCHPLDSAQHAPHPVVCCQMEPAWGGSGGVLRGSVKKNEAWNKGIFWNCRFPKKKQNYVAPTFRLVRLVGSPLHPRPSICFSRCQRNDTSAESDVAHFCGRPTR